MFKSAKDQIWFFDCEWVPDPRTGRLLYGLSGDMPDGDVMKEMWRRGGATEEDPQPFLKTNLCRVVSIAAVMRRVSHDENLDLEDRVKLRLLWLPRNVDDPESNSEASVLTAFLGAVGRHQPQLVGFNSRASDLRILMQRAFVCGISAPEFCRRPDKPWDGVDYFARDNEYCIDLMDVLGGQYKSQPSLNELAVASGIPGKIGVCGDDVAGMWLRGEWRDIVRYNCFDAMTTYLVWLRLAHLGGFVTDEEYEMEQMVFQNMLLEEAEKPEMDFISAYIDEWNRLQDAL